MVRHHGCSWTLVPVLILGLFSQFSYGQTTRLRTDQLQELARQIRAELEQMYLRMKLVKPASAKPLLTKPPLSVAKADLRYAQKTFAQWRQILITDVDPDTRVKAIQALRTLGIYGYQTEANKTIAPFLRLSRTDRVFTAATSALRDLQGNTYLRGGLGLDGLSPQRLVVLLQAFSAVDKLAAQAIISGPLVHSRSSVRIAAIRALGRGEPTPAVCRALREAIGGVAQQADAVGQAIEQFKTSTTALRELIDQCARSNNESLCFRVSRAVIKLGKSEESIRMLEGWLSLPDKNVRAVACDLLVQYGSRNPKIRQTAILLLQERYLPRGVAVMRALATLPEADEEDRANTAAHLATYFTNSQMHFGRGEVNAVIDAAVEANWAKMKLVFNRLLAGQIQQPRVGRGGRPPLRRSNRNVQEHILRTLAKHPEFAADCVSSVAKLLAVSQNARPRTAPGGRAIAARFFSTRSRALSLELILGALQAAGPAANSAIPALEKRMKATSDVRTKLAIKKAIKAIQAAK